MISICLHQPSSASCLAARAAVTRHLWLVVFRFFVATQVEEVFVRAARALLLLLVGLHKFFVIALQGVGVAIFLAENQVAASRDAAFLVGGKHVIGHDIEHRDKIFIPRHSANLHRNVGVRMRRNNPNLLASLYMTATNAKQPASAQTVLWIDVEQANGELRGLVGNNKYLLANRMLFGANLRNNAIDWTEYWNIRLAVGRSRKAIVRLH